MDDNTIKNILKQNGILDILQTDKLKSFRILLQRPELVKYTNKEFLDKDFIRKLSRENKYTTHIFNFLPTEMITNELLLYCVSNINNRVIADILYSLDYTDKKFVKQLLIQNETILKYMPQSIKNNFEFLYTIAKLDDVRASTILLYASEDIKTNIKYILKFIELDPMCIYSVDKSYYKNMKILLAIFKNHIDILKTDTLLQNDLNISDDFFKNEELVYYAIGCMPFKVLENTLRNNINLMVKALQRDKELVGSLPIELLIEAGCDDLLTKELNNIDSNKQSLQERFNDDFKI